MTNSYDQANELEKAIRESAEYRTLRKAYEAVNADPQAKQMFENFRRIQLNLQKKQMMGEPITDEEGKKAEQSLQIIGSYPAIAALMAAEQRMSLLITDLNRIITKPLEELYGTGWV